MLMAFQGRRFSEQQMLRMTRVAEQTESIIPGVSLATYRRVTQQVGLYASMVEFRDMPLDPLYRLVARALEASFEPEISMKAWKRAAKEWLRAEKRRAML